MIERLYDVQTSQWLKGNIKMEEIELQTNPPEQTHQQSTRKQTILVLLGCGILQMPIWGTHPI